MARAQGRRLPRGLKAPKGYRPPAIPDKVYFRIGEVARLLGVKAYVLRFGRPSSDARSAEVGQESPEFTDAPRSRRYS